MNTHRIEEKVEALKKKYANPATPDTFQEIADIEKSLHEAILRNHLASHEGFKPFLKWVLAEIKNIDSSLVSSDSKRLPDHERDRILDAKKLYESFVGFFGDTATILRSLEAEIDQHLTHDEPHR
ncbi:MAG: hypothetical protein Q8L86_12485 [Vicinamibacterales bacterium]|nr:hypothetical protein [Vicinamibacterales bacterium]